jgi:hypothetical protein
MTIRFLTRAGCYLCEEAKPRVLAGARRLGLDLQVVDVDAAGLAGEYGDRVPVVLGPDGRELCSGRIGGLRLAWRLLGVRLRR